MPPMLYLVRHAHAHDAADDTVRPISARGRAELKAIAQILRPSGAFAPALVWHSTLVRARESAEVLLSELGIQMPMEERRELIPEAVPQRAADLIGDVKEPLALFGHEPHLSALASLLVTGFTDPVAFAFQKATVLALEPVGSRWWVRWQVSPDLFPR
jgi:phosphohistidine phosphatase